MEKNLTDDRLERFLVSNTTVRMGGWNQFVATFIVVLCFEVVMDYILALRKRKE